jgi:hypothetical protein
LMMDNLNDQNPHLKFCHFCSMYIIQRFVSHAWYQHKMLFKVFVSFRSNLKQKLMQILCSSEVCLFTELQKQQNTLGTNTLKSQL